MRLRDGSNSWRIGDLQSRLGGALVSVAVTDPAMDAQGREARFAQAELLLSEGYARLQDSPNDTKYFGDALDRMVRLYKAWNKPDKLSEWQQNRLTYEAGRLATSAMNLLRQEKFAEAEATARDCLAIREKNMPDHWGTFNARSMLGGSLLGQKKYGDAELLLLSGYDGLKRRQTQIPPLGMPRVRETLERLVRLYKETSRLEEAGKWQQKLAEFEQKAEEERTANTREVQNKISSSKTNNPSK